MVWKKQITFHTENGPMTVRYFVLASASTSASMPPCYGLGIADEATSYTIPAFSPNKTETIRVAKLLARNLVTPTTFFEVLDDYLACR